MLKHIRMSNDQAGGRYNDILRVAERLADRFGSATNAFAHMVRESPVYVAEMAKMNAEHRRRLRKRGAS